MKHGLYLLLALLLVACYTKPLGVYQVDKTPTAPDYTQDRYWAALPTKKDSADVVLDSSLKDLQATSQVDVFWLHPTTYTGGLGKDNRQWNGPVDDAELNEKTDGSSIKYQASIFNGVGKIYAPRYRQIQLQVFGEYETEKREYADAATKLAYSDVRRAFEYYLENYNQNRPIIIASHSQGTVMAKELLKEFFDGKPLQNRLVAAYLVGIQVDKDLYKNIPLCEKSYQTGCFCSWRTFADGHTPKKYVKENTACTNPISWATDETIAPTEESKGFIIDDKNGAYKGLINARVCADKGILWSEKPSKPTKLVLMTRKNYHIGDYNLFYMDVRANAEERVGAFWK